MLPSRPTCADAQSDGAGLKRRALLRLHRRKTSAMNESSTVVYCNCTHAQVVAPEVRQEVLERLSASGVAFHAVPDLCVMSARQDPTLKRIAETGKVRIAACFPRAVKWLFRAAGAPLSHQEVEVLNMRERSADEIISRLLPEPGSRQEGRS